MTSEDESWDERLAALLPGDLPGNRRGGGPDDGPGAGPGPAASAFIARLPAGYREQTAPDEAAHDLAEITALFATSESPSLPVAETAGAHEDPVMGRAYRLSVRPAKDPECTFRLRRFGVDGIELTRILPLLESFGLVVVESIPLRLGPGSDGTPALHIDDIGIRTDAPYGPEALRFVPEIHGPRLVDAIEASARGDADVDSLNRLVTTAGFDWRQVTVLRAYLRYWSQAGTGLSWDEMADPLWEYPDVTRALIAYFEARFDPDRPEPDPAPPEMGTGPVPVGSPPPPAASPTGHPPTGHPPIGASPIGASPIGAPPIGAPPVGASPVGASPIGAPPTGALAGTATPGGPPDVPAGRPRGARERALCLAQLDLVTQLDEDRVLRAVLGLIDATLRTSYFRPGPGPASAPLVLKLASAAVPELPRPRPRVEAFVTGPTVEGIHLRAGLVARGGIRWSERPSDFRTEVLDLAFAQVKKNAIIVPTGAKGGFVCRGPAAGPLVGLGKVRPGPDQVRATYERFITGLLEITDNIVGGQVVTPDRVVAADGPDPYLVVAADKGTATFSDLANAISDRAGFWLSDAFASGGSRGYDHKAMGITARGAWVAVRRHFRELGVDVQSDPIRVVGVGDMSGDVFGNGMLQSRAIRLLAAFDHRHIFLDPNPDPERSFEERRRLAALDRSSWADYDARLISAGGGVWSRDTKLVPIPLEVRSALSISAEGEESLSPPDLIRAILSASVDLIWFGGIGTFIKAPEESDVEVGDHANDTTRIASDRVRARVIAEGANLAVTQKARIRYSRRGGRINADFIDNAAGVATSDREVNLKILLALAIERGRLDGSERDEYLKRSEGQVAADVLRQVDHSVAALNRAAASSDRDLDAYEAMIDQLEASGRFDRRVEVLPDRDEFQIRRRASAGLIRPELATILAYAKSDLVAAIEDSPRAADPVFLDAVLPYFPTPIRDDFGDLVPAHRLYPQLVATDVAGEIVDEMGIVWAHDLAAETGRGLDEVAVSFWVARAVTGAGELWAELESLTADYGASLKADTEAALHGSVVDAVQDLVRGYLAQPGPFDSLAVADRDNRLAAAHSGYAGLVAKDHRDALAQAGCSPDLAQRFLSARRRVSAIEIGSLVQASGRDGAEVLEALRLVDDVSGVDQLAGGVLSALRGAPPPDRLRVWQGRALIDDLREWRSKAARHALSDGPNEVAASVQRWAARHQTSLQQAAVLLRTVGGQADPLAVATLALRRLNKALEPNP